MESEPNPSSLTAHDLNHPFRVHQALQEMKRRMPKNKFGKSHSILRAPREPGLSPLVRESELLRFDAGKGHPQVKGLCICIACIFRMINTGQPISGMSEETASPPHI